MKLRYHLISITAVSLVLLFGSRVGSVYAAPADSMRTAQTDFMRTVQADPAPIFLPEWVYAVEDIASGQEAVTRSFQEEPSAAMSIDAVSSATGAIGPWMDFYARYGILTVSLPHDEGTHWELHWDPDSSGQVQILQCGETAGVWYAGLQAGSDHGTILLEFDLYQEEKICRRLFAQVQIEDGRIAAVLDYGESSDLKPEY